MLADRSAPDTILFDLDGTLADTAPDLAFALNTLRAEQGLNLLAYDAIKWCVSEGTPALLRLGFGLTPADPGFETLRGRFLEIYAANLARETRLFAGFPEVLDSLDQRHAVWGVVTNKPAWLTEPLLQALGIAHRAACIVSGDSTANRKPHPEPLLHAAKLCGVAPERCVYLGDSVNDIRAGRAAGMTALVAMFGYIHPEEDVDGWGAHGTIAHPQAVFEWLNLLPPG
jgi:phosphoglycolate phosphatase